MKKLLIYPFLLLLAGCNIFERIPEQVIEGQRTIYQGILIAEENDNQIIDRYLQDTKASIIYHTNFLFEPKINDIRKNPDLSRGEKSQKIAELEIERQIQIDNVFKDIERIAEDMRSQAMKNHAITKKLVESIYNYLSTSPIEVDNIEFWIGKLHQISRQEREN